MNPILHIYKNGDWVLERPHATGSDFGPGQYGAQKFNPPNDPTGCNRAIAFYKPSGVEIRDARQRAA